MEQVRLGASGLHVSRVCLGMMSYGSSEWRPWVLDQERAAPIVRAAVEAGITFFDTADIYSDGASEIVTGNLLRPLLSRDELVLATKLFSPMTPGPNGRGLSRKHVLSAIDASLTRLGVDYVDLYQIHRFDPLTPVEETMEALHDVVRAGKARYIGASSMFAWQFAKMQQTAERNGWTPFVSMQNHYNLVYREEEREMIPLCLDQGVGLVPWSPLARGLLAGKRSAPASARSVRSETDAFQDELYGRPRISTWSSAARRSRPRAACRPRRSRSPGSSTSPPSCRSSERRARATSRMRAAATELSLSDRGDREPRSSLSGPNTVRGHD